LLTIEYIDRPHLNFDGVQALLVTSANGARALARRTSIRDLPVLAVGDASARAAVAAGFAVVRSAAGDVAALAGLVKESLNPGAGSLVHAAASEIAGDLAGLLTEAGFVYRREVLYRAQIPDCLSATTATALKGGRVDGALFFSPRTANTFVSLIEREGLAPFVAALYAYCLSPAVADAAGGLEWKHVGVAATPDQNSLLSLVDNLKQVPANPGRQIS
jgi:uroporphyrinogen-III synthase